MISEDDVKKAIKKYLDDRGFENVKPRFGREKGYDVEGQDPSSGRLLAVECKGETNAVNQWDTAWDNAADAIFKALYALYYSKISQPNLDVGIAFPKTANYLKRIHHLQTFCRQQGITVFWVDNEKVVSVW